MSVFAELERRKVFKVGAAYLVVAWLAVQAASIALPAFDAPPCVLRVFVLAALLGFPIAVALAWALESTPDGIRFDTARPGGKRVMAAAAALVVLAIGWYFFGQPSFREKGSESLSGTKAVAAGNVRRPESDSDPLSAFRRGE